MISSILHSGKDKFIETKKWISVHAGLGWGQPAGVDLAAARKVSSEVGSEAHG